MTDLEEGITVGISKENFDKLKTDNGFIYGFISREAYPDEYEKISHKNEIGRFLFFRFVSIDDNEKI